MSVVAVAVAVILASSGARPAPIGGINAIERWRVPPGTHVDVDALGATVRISGLGAARAKITSSICPTVRASSNASKARVLMLECRSRKIKARVAQVPGDSVRLELEIVELRAAPAKDGDASFPLLFDVGADAPDSDDIRAGEAAIAAGKLDRAVKAFTKAMRAADGVAGGSNAVASGRVQAAADYAAVRLGDVAASLDDVDSAVRFWDRAGPTGVFSRLAAARLCEHVGGCISGRNEGVAYSALDSGGLPPAFADEIVLRRARFLAYDGKLVDAMTLLVDKSSACTRNGAGDLCRRIAYEGFQSDDTASAALALTMSLPRGENARARELAMLAAERAASLGAPMFAANLLVSTTSTTPAAELELPLLRSAELYIDAHDLVHAGTVAQFARVRLGAKRLKERARWAAVDAALKNGERT